MVSQGEALGLQVDEFAFYFHSKAGVEAAELGLFLQRAATVARRRGAQLNVTAIRSGSLAVIIQAVASSPIGQATVHEFLQAPVTTTASAVTIVGAVIGAIVYAMSPDAAGATPLGKAGAAAIETGSIDRIELVTISRTIVIMDTERAERVRDVQRWRDERPRMNAPMVERLIHEARAGALTGTIIDVAGELHFRPHGHRYLVPMEFTDEYTAGHANPGRQYRVRANLLTFGGQPNLIVILSLEPL